MTHWRIDSHDVYFVINDSPKAWQGRVQFAASGKAERWDPTTGKATILPARRPVAISLDAYSATFIRFSEPPPAPRLPLKTGPLPNLQVKPLPQASPACGHGEFVVAKLNRVGSAGTEEPPRVVVSSRLTKSKVDTFTFLRFLYEKPISQFQQAGWSPMLMACSTRPGSATSALAGAGTLASKASKCSSRSTRRNGNHWP